MDRSHRMDFCQSGLWGIINPTQRITCPRIFQRRSPESRNATSKFVIEIDGSHFAFQTLQQAFTQRTVNNNPSCIHLRVDGRRLPWNTGTKQQEIASSLHLHLSERKNSWTTGKNCLGTILDASEWSNFDFRLSGSLGDVEKTIVEYWLDGPDKLTPAGHAFRIAADAALAENLSVSETARLLFLVGNALYDSGITSRRTKPTFDYARPISMIQCGAAGQ